MNRKMTALLALLSMLAVLALIPGCASANSAMLYVKTSSGLSRWRIPSCAMPRMWSCWRAATAAAT